MTIGLCTIIGVFDMQVFIYTLESYELALLQAEEILKGVDPLLIKRYPEKLASNGLRVTNIKIEAHMNLIVIQETEISNKVLPIPE